jgi:hypothetical protein
MFAFDDAFFLGVLSSKVHVAFSLAAGGHLGVGNDPRYNKSRCFDPFPFPDCTEKQKDKIRYLAEELDAHRNRAQRTHGLGLTDIYNVVEKVRAGEALISGSNRVEDVSLHATGLKILKGAQELARHLRQVLAFLGYRIPSGIT